MADIVQLRRDTAANWTSANPTLANGEQGYETDTAKMKVGDGVTTWTSLAYFAGSGGSTTWVGLTDTAGSITALQLVRGNSGGTALEMIAQSTLKIDDFGTPDDNTDLNATTGVHGLLQKLGGGTVNFLRADGTWSEPPGAAGGETNTASNTGTVGTGVFKQKVGVDLELYKLYSANNRLTIALNGTDRMDFTINESNINAGKVDSCDAGVATGNVFKIPASIAQGDIFHVNSSGNIIRLAAGTNGYFLKTQGAAADPVWASAGAASGGDAAYVIAANNTPSTIKSRADVSCDAISDETEINTAFATYDTVMLTEGTFIIDGSISMGSNQTLIGSGSGTIIKIKDSFNSGIYMITNSDQVSGNTNILISNLKLDGNRSNQTTGTMYAIEWEKVTESMVKNCWIYSCNTDSHLFITCDRCTIEGNIIVDTGYGPSIESSSKYCSVLGCTIYKTSFNGVYISQSFHTSVKNNMIIASSQYTDDTYDQISILGSSTGNCDFCDIQNNTIRDGEETNNPRYAIRVNSSYCNHTLIANNDCYDCAQSGTFSDVGTNTNWGAGNRKNNGTWATGA